jgi:hypothetical protein
MGSQNIGGSQMVELSWSRKEQTMTNLTNHPLGVAGVQYVVQNLDQHAGLAPALLKVLPSGGTTFAPLPEGVRLARATEFRTGGLLRRKDTLTWLGQHVAALAGAAPHAAFVVQDAWGVRPGDPAAAKITEEHFFNGIATHYFVRKAEIDPESVEAVFCAGSSFLVIGAFARIDIAPSDIPINHAVGDSFVNNLASHVQEIYISAYDGEGVVVWQRP